MKKTIIFTIAAMLLKLSTVSAQETFFSNNRDAEFVYESGAMDIGAKGTAKLLDSKGGSFVLDVTYYIMGPDFFNKENPRNTKMQISFKDGEYKRWKGSKENVLSKGEVYNNRLRLSGDNGGWTNIILEKENTSKGKKGAAKTTKTASISKAIKSSKAAKVNYLKLKNVWKGTYVNIEKGLSCGDIAPGWHSAQWVLEPVDGTSFVRIKNRWKNTYLNIEKGLSCGEIAPGWHSAQWIVEPIKGTNAVRIKNRWKGTYLNIESGALQCTEIALGWSSAKWEIN